MRSKFSELSRTRYKRQSTLLPSTTYCNMNIEAKLRVVIIQFGISYRPTHPSKDDKSLSAHGPFRFNGRAAMKRIVEHG